MTLVVLGIWAFIMSQCNSTDVKTTKEATKLGPIRDKLTQFGKDYGVNIGKLRADAVAAAKPSKSSLSIPFWDDHGYDQEQIVLIPSEIMPAFERFVERKKKATDDDARVWYFDEDSQTAKNYYKDHCPTGYDLIKKCIEKRAIIFMGSSDVTLLRDPANVYEPADPVDKHTSAKYEWKAVGKKAYEESSKKPSIEKYLTYDEMNLSAFLLFAGPTIFFNDGDRKNNGKVQYGVDKPNSGYLIGTSGPRFEKKGVMDRLLYIKKDHDPIMAQIIFGEYYEELIEETEIWDTTLPDTPSTVYVDLLKERYKISYGAYLKYVVATMKEKHSPGTKAYVAMTGLGVGVWAFAKPQQQKIILKAVIEVLDEMSAEDRKWIGTIDFIFFEHLGKDKKTHKGINLIFTKNTGNFISKPSVRRDDDGLIIFVLFAWDGNSIPGNEFWMSMFHASDDPAKVASSQAFVNLNPFINTRLPKNVYTFVDGTTTLEKVEKPKGGVSYQRGRFTPEQFAAIQYYNDMGTGTKSVVLFGDNDEDKIRADRAKRRTGGQAGALKMASPAGGWFDQKDGDKVAFGIVTTYYLVPKCPSVDKYIETVLKPAAVELKKKLDEGYQIIVPYGPDPGQCAKPEDKEKFFDKTVKDKQVIFHNLGTSIAGLSDMHLSAIEDFIDDLDESAKKKIGINCFDPSKKEQNKIQLIPFENKEVPDCKPSIDIPRRRRKRKNVVKEPIAIVIPEECPYNYDSRTAEKRVQTAIVFSLVVIAFSILMSMFIYYR